MAIKFEKIEPGMELLDIHRERMGNTTMSEWGLWKVRVISVDKAHRTAVVSWNGNAPKTWDAYRLQKLHTKPTKAYREQCERRQVTGSRW
jgi:hypothetical protein